MAENNKKKVMLPIFDIYENIYNQNKPEDEGGYPYVEGQIFFAKDIKRTFVDKGGFRTSDMATYYLGEINSGLSGIEDISVYKGCVINFRDNFSNVFTYFVKPDDLELIRLDKQVKDIYKVIEQYQVSEDSSPEEDRLMP